MAAAPEKKSGAVLICAVRLNGVPPDFGVSDKDFFVSDNDFMRAAY